MLISNNVEFNPFTSSNTSGQREVNILVVDDDPQVVETVTTVLERMGGYKVLVARSGAECLQQVKERKPALVLLDIHMPQVDGLQVLRQLRAQPEINGLPILMVSVDAQLEQMGACFEAGATGFLIKPFDPADLYRQVRSAIARHGADLLRRDVLKKEQVPGGFTSS
jgi:CheY-like chemotaxis protein